MRAFAPTLPPDESVRRVTLHPGDVACGTRGDRLETLLGSCVSIVMTDPRRTVGAMCHIVHANRAPAGADHPTAFADEALAEMQRRLRAVGVVPSLCEAWVYGGGNMFPGLISGRHVGGANADWALEALQSLGVRVLATDIGGATYRRLSWTVGPEAPSVEAVRL